MTADNRIGIIVGTVLLLAAAILRLGKFLGDNTFPIILAFLGIVAVGTSEYRRQKGS